MRHLTESRPVTGRSLPTGTGTAPRGPGAGGEASRSDPPDPGRARARARNARNARDFWQFFGKVLIDFSSDS